MFHSLCAQDRTDHQPLILSLQLIALIYVLNSSQNNLTLRTLQKKYNYQFNSHTFVLIFISLDENLLISSKKVHNFFPFVQNLYHFVLQHCSNAYKSFSNLPQQSCHCSKCLESFIPTTQKYHQCGATQNPGLEFGVERCLQNSLMML